MEPRLGIETLALFKSLDDYVNPHEDIDGNIDAIDENPPAGYPYDDI